MRAPPGPGTPLILSGAIAPAVVSALTHQLAELLAAGDGRPVVCDVSRIGVDLAAVDGLGHLQLEARRLGGSIALRGTSAELAELLELCGLAGAILGDCREAVGQPEQREQAIDVQECIEPGDLAV